jgi:membrane protein DedA with SNARE-associated domain
VLTYIGWYLGRHFSGGLSQEMVHRYTTWALLALIPILAVTITVYVIRHRKRSRAVAEPQV